MEDFKVWLAELKAKSDIVSVMSKYCNLVQKGRNYWTCCPFHIEKTPSLCIYDYEQTYHCYGCKEHGDVIRFVMNIESCDFMQAVEILAKNVGMEIPDFSFKNSDGIEKRKKDKDDILNCLTLTKDYYIENLYSKDAKPAQEYIKARGLTKSELNSFGLGYSKDYNSLVSFLKNKGISEDIMLKAGVVAKNQNGGIYDFFAYRLTFPLFNMYNECVGFSARILTDDKTKAKYKNSSNSIVFDKSNMIYGLNILRKLKQTQSIDKFILVEGQMDVIAMHKAGFKNTVASLGTAFTEQHAKQLKLISNNAYVCLDADKAGKTSAFKTSDVLANAGFNVKVICLPKGQDPDEFINNNSVSAMSELIDNAKDYIIFQLDFLAEDIDFSKSEQKAKFLRDALNLLSKLSTNSEKQVYLKHIRSLSGVPIDVLQQDVLKQPQKGLNKTEQKISPSSLEDGTNKAIKFVLASMLYKKEYVNYSFNLKKYLKSNTYLKLYDLIMEKHKENSCFKVSALYDEFDFDSDENLIDIVNYNFENNGNNEKYYNECLWNIVEKCLLIEQQSLNEQYLASQDINQRKEILLKISEISKKLKSKKMEDLF